MDEEEKTNLEKPLDASKIVDRTCKYCGVVRRCRSDLERHLLLHTGEQPYRCQVCNNRFKSKRNLQYHLENIHRIFVDHKEIRMVPEENPKDIRNQNQVVIEMENGENFLLQLADVVDGKTVTNSPGSTQSPVASNEINVGGHTVEVEVEGQTVQGLVQQVQGQCHLSGTSSVQSPMPFNSPAQYNFVTGNNGLPQIVATNRSQEFMSKRTCTYCGKICLKPSDLKRHLRKHTGERPFKCSYCSKAFKAKPTLLYHLKNQHQIVDIELSSLEETKSADDSRNSIDFEPDSSDVKMDIKQHSFRPSPIETSVDLNADSIAPIPNEQESQSTVKETPIVSRVEYFDTSGNLTATRYKCHICIKTFQYLVQVHDHQAEHLHEIDVIYTCPHCMSPFKEKMALVDHVIRVHKDMVENGADTVAMDTIENSTTTKVGNYATQKKKLFHGLGPFRCKFCAKSFATYYRMKRHAKQVHSAVKPCWCKICKKGFAEVRNLRQHNQRFHPVLSRETKLAASIIENNEVKHVPGGGNTVSETEVERTPITVTVQDSDEEGVMISEGAVDDTITH